MRRLEHDGEKMELKISAVVITYNRPEKVQAILKEIAKQSHPPNEILVINNGVIDSAFRAELKKAKIIIKDTKENSVTVAKKLAISEGKCELISFLDDDMELDPDYFSETIKFFNKYPKAYGVMGLNTGGCKYKGVLNKIMTLYKNAFYIRKSGKEYKLMPSLGLVYGPDDKVSKAEWLSGACTWKRKILREVEPDVNLKKYSYNEDIDLSYRVAKKFKDTLFFAPSITYLHKKVERRRNKEISHMVAVYDYYLFYKLMEQTILNRAIFFWGRIGRVAMDSVLLKSKHPLGSEIFSLLNRRSLKRLDLSFFNSEVLNEKN